MMQAARRVDVVAARVGAACTFGGKHGDSPWRCSVLYRDRQKASGRIAWGGVVLRLELGLGEGVVIADVGAAQRAPRSASSCAGRAVGVQGEDLGLGEAGLLDQRCGEGGVLRSATIQRLLKMSSKRRGRSSSSAVPVE